MIVIVDCEESELKATLTALLNAPIVLRSIKRTLRRYWLVFVEVRYRLEIEVVTTKPAVSLTLNFGHAFNPQEHSMSAVMFPNQRVLLTVYGKDEDGNPAPIEGATFSSSDESIVSIVEDGDGDDKTVYAQAMGVVGDVQISASADPKIGEEVGEPLTVIDTLSVKPREAVSIGIGFGVPETIPTA